MSDEEMEGALLVCDHIVPQTAADHLQIVFADQLMFDADYGFEYSDEDVQEEDVDIENQYYNSKGKPYYDSCMPQASVCQPIRTDRVFLFNCCIMHC